MRNLTAAIGLAAVWVVAVSVCHAQGVWDQSCCASTKGVIVDVSKVERVPVDDEHLVNGEWEIRADKQARGETLLCAGPDAVCPDVAVDLGAQGWHGIYVGFVRPSRQSRHCGTGAAVRLSRDAYRVPLLPGAGRQEIFFKNADLTGQRTVFSNILGRPAAIDYVRIVPLNQEQVAQLQRAAAAPQTMDVAAICDANMHYVCYGSGRRRDVFDMVASHAACGFNGLYYIANTGTLFYQTNVADRYTANGDVDASKSALTIRRFPVLRDAVAAGRQVGIPVYGWYRMNNEFGRKGHELPALCSKLFLSRPDLRCVYPNGKTDDSKLSFAFEEVRQYRLAILKEMVEFGVDGLMLGFRRHPPMMRYEKPLVEGYQAKCGIDPRKIDGRKDRAGYLRWLQFRANVMTEFIRGLRRELGKMGRADLPVAVRVRAQTFEANLGEGVDLRTWVRERLVDEIHAFAGYSQNVPPVDIPGRLQPIVDLCRGTGIKVYGGSQDRTVRSAREMQDAVAFVHETGADGITVYESEAMVALAQIRAVMERARTPQRVARPWLAFSSSAAKPAFPWRPKPTDPAPWWQIVMAPVPAGSRVTACFDGSVEAKLSAAREKAPLTPVSCQAVGDQLTGPLRQGIERLRIAVPRGCTITLRDVRIERPGDETLRVGYRATSAIQVADLADGVALDRPRHFQVLLSESLAPSAASVSYFIDGRLASIETQPPYYLGGDYHRFDVRRLGSGEHVLRVTLDDDVLRSPWQRTYTFRVAVPEAFGKGDLCASTNGGKIVRAVNNRWGHSKDWKTNHLIDGSIRADHPKKTCWMCRKTGEAVIRLAHRAKIRRIVLSNYYTDVPYTRQAKMVALLVAQEADGPFTEVGTSSLPQMVNYWDTVTVRFKPVAAQFLKVTVKSNYGHSDQSVLNFVEAYED